MLEKTAAHSRGTMFQVSLRRVLPIAQQSPFTSFLQVSSLSNLKSLTLLRAQTGMVPPLFHTKTGESTIGVLVYILHLESKVAGSSPISVAWFP